MNCSSLGIPAEKQAAMTTRVLRVVLNNLAAHDDLPHFLRCNHSIGPRHLPDRVREKKDLLSRRLKNGSAQGV